MPVLSLKRNTSHIIKPAIASISQNKNPIAVPIAPIIALQEINIDEKSIVVKKSN